MKNEITNLKINMAQITTKLDNFDKKLTEHIDTQKETDKKVDFNFNKIFEKIDNLSDTFEVKVQSKADHKEVMGEFEKIDSKYVTKQEFSNVQKVVYGMIGVVLTSVLLVILGLALKKIVL